MFLKHLKMVQKCKSSTDVLSALKNLAQKMRKTKMRLKLAQHYENQYSEAKEMHKEWEKRHLCIMTPGGIKTETGGIDPT